MDGAHVEIPISNYLYPTFINYISSTLIFFARGDGCCLVKGFDVCLSKIYDSMAIGTVIFLELTICNCMSSVIIKVHIHAIRRCFNFVWIGEPSKKFLVIW
jgi:hypothetical protein